MPRGKETAHADKKLQKKAATAKLREPARAFRGGGHRPPISRANVALGTARTRKRTSDRENKFKESRLTVLAGYSLGGT